jgi:hypothetical protein
MVSSVPSLETYVTADAVGNAVAEANLAARNAILFHARQYNRMAVLSGPAAAAIVVDKDSKAPDGSYFNGVDGENCIAYDGWRPRALSAIGAPRGVYVKGYTDHGCENPLTDASGRPKVRSWSSSNNDYADDQPSIDWGNDPGKPHSREPNTIYIVNDNMDLGDTPDSPHMFPPDHLYKYGKGLEGIRLVPDDPNPAKSSYVAHRYFDCDDTCQSPFLDDSSYAPDIGKDYRMRSDHTGICNGFVNSYLSAEMLHKLRMGDRGCGDKYDGLKYENGSSMCPTVCTNDYYQQYLDCDLGEPSGTWQSTDRYHDNWCSFYPGWKGLWSACPFGWFCRYNTARWESNLKYFRNGFRAKGNWEKDNGPSLRPAVSSKYNIRTAKDSSNMQGMGDEDYWVDTRCRFHEHNPLYSASTRFRIISNSEVLAPNIDQILLSARDGSDARAFYNKTQINPLSTYIYFDPMEVFRLQLTKQNVTKNDVIAVDMTSIGENSYCDYSLNRGYKPNDRCYGLFIADMEGFEGKSNGDDYDYDKGSHNDQPFPVKLNYGSRDHADMPEIASKNLLSMVGPTLITLPYKYPGWCYKNKTEVYGVRIKNIDFSYSPDSSRPYDNDYWEVYYGSEELGPSIPDYFPSKMTPDVVTRQCLHQSGTPTTTGSMVLARCGNPSNQWMLFRIP